MVSRYDREAEELLKMRAVRETGYWPSLPAETLNESQPKFTMVPTPTIRLTPEMIDLTPLTEAQQALAERISQRRTR